MSASTGINYLHAGILLGVPSLALYGILTTPLMTGTFWFSVFYYFFTGLGITAGKQLQNQGHSSSSNWRQVITGCGLTRLSRLVGLSKRSWPSAEVNCAGPEESESPLTLLQPAPWKEASDGGAEIIGPIIAIPTLTRYSTICL